MWICFGLGLGLMMASCGGDDDKGQDEGKTTENQTTDNPSTGNQTTDNGTTETPANHDPESGAEIKPGEGGEETDPEQPRLGAADGENGFTDLSWPEPEYYYCGDYRMKGSDKTLDKYCVDNYGAGEIGYCYKEVKNEEEGEVETKVCFPGCSVKGQIRDKCEFLSTENLGEVNIHFVYQCVVRDNHLIEDVVDMRKCVHACNSAGNACD